MLPTDLVGNDVFDKRTSRQPLTKRCEKKTLDKKVSKKPVITRCEKAFDKKGPACQLNWPNMGPCMFIIAQFQNGSCQKRSSLSFFDHQFLSQKVNCLKQTFFAKKRAMTISEENKIK